MNEAIYNQTLSNELNELIKLLDHKYMQSKLSFYENLKNIVNYNDKVIRFCSNEHFTDSIENIKKNINDDSIDEADHFISILLLSIYSKYYDNLYSQYNTTVNSLIKPVELSELIDNIKTGVKKQKNYNKILLNCVRNLALYNYQQHFINGYENTLNNAVSYVDEQVKQITFIKTILNEVEYKTDKNIVCIGANGSGKSRFANDLLKITRQSIGNNTSQHNLFVIPSEKYINLNTNINGIYIDQITNNLQTPDYKNMNNNDNTLITLLVSCANTTSGYDLENNTFTGVLGDIVTLWKQILNRENLSVDREETGNPYKFIMSNAKNNSSYPLDYASSGERTLLYYLLLLLNRCVIHDNSFVLIDEPETYLETNTVIKLFDELENIRNDCTFMYLTHNIDFATSRKNANHLWLKEYRGNMDFDIKKIPSKDNIPYELLTKIYGSSRNILFCEGDRKSIDYTIYSVVFNDYNIYPVGSCDNVVKYTKAMKNMPHHDAIGIIDRDYKSDEKVEELKKSNVYALPYVDIESLLISKCVLLKYYESIKSTLPEQDYTNATNNSIKNIIDTICKNQNKLDSEINDMVKQYINCKLETTRISGKNLDCINQEIKNLLTNLETECSKLHKKISSELDCNTPDYEKILKTYKTCGSNKDSFFNIVNREYKPQIINLVRNNNDLKKIIRDKIIPPTGENSTTQKPPHNPPSSTSPSFPYLNKPHGHSKHFSHTHPLSLSST
jgi:ABC-type cobalamin/Fe3+-siderophores transport system ATPase subunit